MPDYGCHPLWMITDSGARENTDPHLLPITTPLAHDLAAWAASYDDTLNHDHPPDSQFPDPGPDPEDAFWATGVLLACRLAIELVDRYTVAVYDGRRSGHVTLPANGGVRAHGGRILLPEHWSDLSEEPGQRQALTDQLHRELPVGHVLDGRDVELIARCRRCDDILIHLRDHGEYGIVHLTWRKGPEISPAWPSTDLHLDPAALLADLIDRHL
jgi:hypothetical protein